MSYLTRVGGSHVGIIQVQMYFFSYCYNWDRLGFNFYLQLLLSRGTVTAGRGHGSKTREPAGIVGSKRNIQNGGRPQGT